MSALWQLGWEGWVSLGLVLLRFGLFAFRGP